MYIPNGLLVLPFYHPVNHIMNANTVILLFKSIQQHRPISRKEFSNNKTQQFSYTAYGVF